MRSTTPAPGATSAVADVQLLPPSPATDGLWATRCRRHDTIETWPSRRVAGVARQYSADLCGPCGARWRQWARALAELRGERAGREQSRPEFPAYVGWDGHEHGEF